MFNKWLAILYNSRLHLQIIRSHIYDLFYHVLYTNMNKTSPCILSSICPRHQMHSGLLKRSPKRIDAKQFNILSASANMNLKLRFFALNLLRGAFRFAHRLFWRHSTLPFAIDSTVALLLKPLLVWINACVRVCISRLN